MRAPYIQFMSGYENLKMQMSYMNKTEPLLNKLSQDISSGKWKDLDSSFYNDFIKDYYDASKRTTRSQYLYNLTIISLYGLFEQFIESQIERFAKLITLEVKKYHSLPKKMRDMHCDLTLKYAQRNLDDRYVSEEVKADNHFSLITSLYQSLDGNSDGFTVNEKVYSNHTSNFRYDLITSLFSNVGVERIIDKTLSINSLQTFYKDFFGLDDGSDHNEIVKSISGEILELVLRRNRIAHGEIEENKLSYYLLLEKCEFFNKLCDGISHISDVAMKYHLSQLDIINDEAFCMASPAEYFDKQSAFGFSIKDLNIDIQGKYIYEGQSVYVEKKGKDLIEKFSIASIYYQGKAETIFETTDTFDFAIRLFGVNNVKDYKGCIFYFGEG